MRRVPRPEVLSNNLECSNEEEVLRAAKAALVDENVDRVSVLDTLCSFGERLCVQGEPTGLLRLASDIELFTRLGDEGRGVALYLSSTAHSLLGEREKAFAEIQRALQLLRGVGSRREPRALLCLANLQTSRDNLEAALEVAETMLCLAEELGDRRSEADATNQLAIISFYQGQLERALVFAQDALRLYRAVGSTSDQVTCLFLQVQINLTFVSSGAPPLYGSQAMSRVSDALVIAKSSGDVNLQASATFWRAQILSYNMKDEALLVSRQAEGLFKLCRDAKGEAGSLALNATLLLDLGQKDAASDTARKALQLAQASGNFDAQASAELTMNAIEEPDVGGTVPAPVVAGTVVAATAPVLESSARVLDPHTVKRTLMRLVKDVAATDEEIEADAALMESGVDSLSSVTLVGEVTNAFGINVSPQLVFDYPTVREIVDHLVEESRG